MLTPAFLSARPKAFKVKATSPAAIAVAQAASCQVPNKVRDYQSNQSRTYGLNVKGSMYGSISFDHRQHQKDKQKHVEKFLKEYPNIPVVFIGDDGQGDCAAGMTMAKTMSGVEAVFIHAIRKYPQNKCRKHKVSTCD